jgi:hypothetical protein
MSDIETLTEQGITFLAALRDASALRREPSAVRPDGFVRSWTVTDLVADGRMLGGDTENKPAIAGLDKAARGLCKRGLAARRTFFGKSFYTLTDGGIALLARIETEAGITSLVAAQLAHEQALADLRLANRRVSETREQLRTERKAFGGAYPWDVLLNTRRGKPLVRR